MILAKLGTKYNLLLAGSAGNVARESHGSEWTAWLSCIFNIFTLQFLRLAWPARVIKLTSKWWYGMVMIRCLFHFIIIPVMQKKVDKQDGYV